MDRAHLASLVQEFRQHPAETAVVAHRGNRRYATRYGDLAKLAGRFSAELLRRQIAPGDRVVLWGENSAEWIAAFFGCLLRGVLAVPLDAAGSSEFAARVIADVSPKLIVGDRELLRELQADLPRLLFSALAAELPPQPEFSVSEAVQAETPFQIVFTSGTTSDPKGIVHTHRNVLASLQPIENEIAKYRKYERWVHPLRFLHTIPLSHVFGQFMGLWLPPILAAEVHFLDQLAPVRMLAMIPRERVSVLVAVPRIVQLLRSQLLAQFPGLDQELQRAQDLQRAQGLPVHKRWWRFRRVHSSLGWKFWAVISGGASLPPELESFWNGLGFALIQGYGMTETAALVTLNHPFHIGKGTIGKALPGREVRLSEQGEILVRGDMLAGATWQHGRMQAREGEWLATGDLAAQSDSGELRFLGRKGDVIVTSAGMNVHPADLEQALTAQAGVRACVVVPCETAAGAEPIAVVLSEGSDADLQGAVGQANRGLADFQQLRRVLRWPDLELPYTSTGKLLRRKVTQWACAQVAAQMAAPLAMGQPGASAPGAEQDELRALIAEVTGDRVTGDRVSGQGDQMRLLQDLHLDSLARVQLLSLLEQRLGVELQDDAIAGVETLGQLRGLVAAAAGGVTAEAARSAWPQNARPSAGAGRSNQPGLEAAVAVSPGAATPAAVPAVPSPLPTARPNANEDVYPRWPWSWPVQALRVVFIEVVMRPLIWILAAPRVGRGGAALPAGPVLIIANHVTAYDAALILYALPARLRRRMVIAMSGEMLMDFRRGRNQGSVQEGSIQGGSVQGGSALLNLLAPLAYWTITALFNVFPLPRLRGFRRSFLHAGEALDRGYSVLIFPEGRRSRSGELQPFRPGIGLLAQESNVSVVPVAVQGLGPREQRWFHSGRIRVQVGSALPADDSIAPAEQTARLEESVRRLDPEAR